MIRFILISLHVLLACTGAAATWYVDFVAGNDANPGTLALPWKRCPGMSTCTVSQSIAHGDSILFKKDTIHTIDSDILVKAGVYYGAYGAGARPILNGGHTTVRCFDSRSGADDWSSVGLQVEDFGSYPDNDTIYNYNAVISSVDTGTEVITTIADHNLTVGQKINFSKEDAAVYPSPITGGPTSERDFYVKTVPSSNSLTIYEDTGPTNVDIDITGIQTGTVYIWQNITAPKSGHGFDLSENYSDNVLIDDCVITRMGQWRNLPPMTGANSVTGIGIYLKNNNGVTVSNCSINKTRMGIAIKSTAGGGPIENILIDNCDVYETVWGIDIAPNQTGAILQNILIKRSKFRDMSMYDSGNWQGFSDNPHTDGIFLRSPNMVSTWTNVDIDGCEFYKDTPENSNGGTASIYVSQGPSVDIYNCIFIQDRHARCIDVISGGNNASQHVRIYNNTFVNSSFISFGNIYTMPDRQWHVANNLFLRTNQPAGNAIWIVQDHSATPMTDLDHNVYWNTQVSVLANKAWNIATGGGKYMTFAQLQGIGWETNGRYENPLLTDTTGLPSTMNLRPLAGSSVIGRGKNLSAYFTTDKDGNARPASGSWDVGAYASGFAPPADVTAPTLLSLSLAANGSTMTAIYDEPMQSINLAHYAIAGHTLGSLSGSGTTWTWTISPVKASGPDFNVTYTAGTTEDLAGNPLASATWLANNDSLENTPDPPRAKRRARGHGHQLLGR